MSTASDLTTLAAVKQWLQLTSSADDALLGQLISTISQAVLADLGRPCLLPSVYSETFDGADAGHLVLRQWPVTNVTACSVDDILLPAALAPGQSGYVLEQGDSTPPGGVQSLWYRGGRFAHGCQNVTVTYRAGYEIQMEAAIVPATAPFVVTALAPYGAWASDTGVAGVSGAYSAVAGVYTFAPAAAGQAVYLSYGYVPSDLAQAANEWIADRYAARTRIGQSAKTLGGQETTSFIVKAMPEVVDRLLQPYRRVPR